MDRLCSGIFLLLVTALTGTIEEKDIDVHLDTTSNITVCEGAPVQINCTYQPSGKYKVSWHFDKQMNNKCESHRLSEGASFTIPKNTDRWSTLTIPSITINDSGWYFCKVTRDIPFLVMGCSKGLHVLVEAKRASTQGLNQTPNPDATQNQSTTNLTTTCSSGAATPRQPPFIFGHWWIWIALAVGCAVLLVLIVVTWRLACKTKEIIYENTATKKSGCWRRSQTQMDSCSLPASKKVETIKPLRKYDTLSQNRIRRP